MDDQTDPKMSVGNRALVHLFNHGVLRVTGPDAVRFLQGQSTNDFNLFTNTRGGGGFTAWLNAKGRYLFDTTVSVQSGRVYLQGPRWGLESLEKHFVKYRLRSKVEFQDISDQTKIWSVLGKPNEVEKVQEANKDNLVSILDPRSSHLGALLVTEGKEYPSGVEEFPRADLDVWNTLRIIHGIPLGGLDMGYGKALPGEANLDLINGVSYSKGCYLGQELTARTHFQGLIRKRLMPVFYRSSSSASSSTPLVSLSSFLNNNSSESNSSLLSYPFLDLHASPLVPPPSADYTEEPPHLPIMMGSDEVGKLFSCSHNVGIALIRVEHAYHPSAPLLCTSGSLTVQLIPFAPQWWSWSVASTTPVSS